MSGRFQQRDRMPGQKNGSVPGVYQGFPLKEVRQFCIHLLSTGRSGAFAVEFLLSWSAAIDLFRAPAVVDRLQYGFALCETNKG